MARHAKESKPVSQHVIVDDLRERIIGGAIAPGEKLPTHEQLQARFRTTRVTVQRALDRLAADGFIRTRPKVGSFVSDKPPHLSRYGLVFNNAPVEGSFPQWGRFDDAIVEASRVIAAEDGISFAIYHDVNGHTDSEGYQTLMRDIEAQRLAGIAFTFAPHLLESTPLMERTDPPRVNDDPLYRPGHVTRIVDDRRFFYRALDFLLANGRKRFAVITKPSGERGYPDEFEAAAAARGAITHPFWTQAVEPHQTRWVRHAVDAILSTHAAEPPDSLLITDDHLVEPVAEALVEFGIRVPEQMRVIGHWNFPLQYRGQVPIDLLGFDSRELVREWVGAIDAQRRGEKVPYLKTLQPRFSWELSPQPISKIPAGVPAAEGSIST